MRRKLLGVLLAVIMVFCMAGCGKSGDKKESTDTSSKTDAAADDSKTEDSKTADTSDKGTNGDNKLTVWCWDKAFNCYAMEEAAKIYQKDHPDFKLEVVETPWEDVQTKLTTAATAGDYSTLPDIMLIQDNAFQKSVLSYPDAFNDITSAGVDFSKFAAAKTAYSIVNGKNYGVPFDNGAVIACYRTDYLEQAGYTVKDFTDITWSQYLDMGKKILEKTGKPLLSCQAGSSDVIMMMLQSAGGSLFDKDGKPAIVDNEILNKVVEEYVQLVKSGVLIEVNDWDQYIGTLNNSTVAGTMTGCWIMASIQSAKDQSGKWAITNMPKLDGIATATNFSNNGGSSWAVTSNCKNVKLAGDFFAKTFGGSVALYETILPSSGALATYLPAADSQVYAQKSDFFGGDTVFSKITDFASKVPSNNTGIYYYEARDAVTTAITNVIGGADLKAELKSAQDTVNFAMGN